MTLVQLSAGHAAVGASTMQTSLSAPLADTESPAWQPLALTQLAPHLTCCTRGTLGCAHSVTLVEHRAALSQKPLLLPS